MSEEIEKALIDLHTKYAVTPKVVYQIEAKERTMNKKLVAALRLSISGYFDDAYVYGDELLARVMEDIKNNEPPPLNGDQIREGFKQSRYVGEQALKCFSAGVRFAERMREEEE